MKCNQPRPGFELVSPCSFPTTISITPRAPPNIDIQRIWHYITNNGWYVIKPNQIRNSFSYIRLYLLNDGCFIKLIGRGIFQRKTLPINVKRYRIFFFYRVSVRAILFWCCDRRNIDENNFSLSFQWGVAMKIIWCSWCLSSSDIPDS